MVALLRSGRVRWTDASDVVEETGGAVLTLETLRSQDRLFDDGSDAADLDSIEHEVQAWADEGMRLLTVLDPDYPANLRSIWNRPPILFVSGSLQAADDRSVAVVGSRKASPEGLAQAKRVASHVSEAGYTIFSGLAAGVDAAAHQAALERGARTVAVIGTGLRRRYPKENAALQEEIGQRAALLSQFWPDQPPTKQTFPMRNAVMSGLARATVVIEAGETSGARMQARLAREHGRPVFLLDSLRDQEWARGAAEHPGTQFVREPQQVVEYLDLLAKPETVFA